MKLKKILLSIFFLQKYYFDKTNEEIFFDQIKTFRTNPETLRDELSSNWIPYIDNKMLNSTIILENGQNDITNLMLYLDNKENFKFDNIRIDQNLSKIAKQQARYMSNIQQLSYYENNYSLDDRIQGKGAYKGLIFELVFKFSTKIPRITNNFDPQKKNRELLNSKNLNFVGIGFEKKKNFIYGSLILSEKFICLSECI